MINQTEQTHTSLVIKALLALPKQISEVFNPQKNWESLRTLKSSSAILMTVMIVANVLVFTIQKQFDLLGWIGLVTSLSVVVNLILVDEGKITNYSWGILGCIVYLVISLNNHLIGDIASRIFYLVMQFVGIATWNHHLEAVDNEDDQVLQPRKISLKTGLSFALMTIAIYLLVVKFSFDLHGAQVYLDATLLPLSIVGMFLMTNGYQSQWLIWIALNLISTFIWFRQLQAISPAAMTMLFLNFTKLVNSLYGLYLWSTRRAE